MHVGNLSNTYDTGGDRFEDCLWSATSVNNLTVTGNAFALNVVMHVRKHEEQKVFTVA